MANRVSNYQVIGAVDSEAYDFSVQTGPTSSKCVCKLVLKLTSVSGAMWVFVVVVVLFCVCFAFLRLPLDQRAGDLKGETEGRAERGRRPSRRKQMRVKG